MPEYKLLRFNLAGKYKKSGHDLARFYMEYKERVKTLNLVHDGHHFAYDILKIMFFNEYACIVIQISQELYC